MKAKDTGSSDWPEGEPSAEQKVTLEDYQQLIIQMRKAAPPVTGKGICHSVRYWGCDEAVKASCIPNAP